MTTGDSCINSGDVVGCGGELSWVGAIATTAVSVAIGRGGVGAGSICSELHPTSARDKTNSTGTRNRFMSTALDKVRPTLPGDTLWRRLGLSLVVERAAFGVERCE